MVKERAAASPVRGAFPDLPRSTTSAVVGLRPLMTRSIPTPRERAATAIERLNQWHARLLRYWSDGAPEWAPEKATEIRLAEEPRPGER